MKAVDHRGEVFFAIPSMRPDCKTEDGKLRCTFHREGCHKPMDMVRCSRDFDTPVVFVAKQTFLEARLKGEI